MVYPLSFRMVRLADTHSAANTTWAGHHRKTAPLETVICGPSFEKRFYLQQMCSRGYTVSKSPLNLFWASDLLHRMFHVPTISEGRIEHVAGADGYDGSLELAMSGEPRAVENSDSLQYFALEVFAERVAEPGIGCL